MDLDEPTGSTLLTTCDRLAQGRSLAAGGPQRLMGLSVLVLQAALRIWWGCSCLSYRRPSEADGAVCACAAGGPQNVVGLFMLVLQAALRG